jgi:hypothetical protein
MTTVGVLVDKAPFKEPGLEIVYENHGKKEDAHKTALEIMSLSREEAARR